jgi:hypothetical protein
MKLACKRKEAKTVITWEVKILVRGVSERSERGKSGRIIFLAGLKRRNSIHRHN